MTRDEKIYALRVSAAGAADWEQVAICNAALAGDAAAITECLRVIADAQAESDYQERLEQQEAAS